MKLSPIKIIAIMMIMITKPKIRRTLVLHMMILMMIKKIAVISKII